MLFAACRAVSPTALRVTQVKQYRTTRLNPDNLQNFENKASPKTDEEIRGKLTQYETLKPLALIFALCESMVLT